MGSDKAGNMSRERYYCSDAFSRSFLVLLVAVMLPSCTGIGEVGDSSRHPLKCTSQFRSWIRHPPMKGDKEVMQLRSTRMALRGGCAVKEEGCSCEQEQHQQEQEHAPQGTSLPSRGEHIENSVTPLRACDVWEVASGPGKLGDVDEFNFTVLRNRVTGVGVEFVHDDDEMVIGFFRFISADVFCVTPDYPIYANMTLDCPGWACFVNGHHTGDFLQAPDLYNALASSPGAHPLLLPQDGTPVTIGVSWTARVAGNCIVVQHEDPCCSRAHLVLTAEGFVYLGCSDAQGYFGRAPQAVVVEGEEEPRYAPLGEAHANFSHVLPPPAPEEEDGEGAETPAPDLGTKACPSGGFNK